MGRDRAKLKRILDFNRELRASKSKSTQVATMTIGELLRKLGETEAVEQQAAKHFKQASDGALLAGSREALHFVEACKLREWASSIRTDLYANATVDKLRAKAAAETGGSKLTLEYVRKLAGELAQQESLGYEAVKERLVGDLLGRRSTKAPDGDMSSNKIWVDADPKLLETLKKPSTGGFGEKQRLAALLRIIPDPDALNDDLQRIERAADELLSMFRSDTNPRLMQTGIELADATDQHVESVRAMRDSVHRVLSQLRGGVVDDKAGDREPAETNTIAGRKEKGGSDNLPREEILKQLPDAQRKAYVSLMIAELKAEGKFKRDDDAYDYLKAEGIPDGAALDDYSLPALDTWKRHVRGARLALGEQKNKRRAGRTHGKSIVRRDES